MIESLKNTCVLPASQEQAMAIVALYEAAGGQIWVDSSLPEWDGERPIGLWIDGDIIHADLVGSETQRITFHELCWNYGIAPTWVKALVEWGGEYYWRGDKLHQSLKSDNVFEYSEDGLIASRELISTRPAEKPKRKTLQDALEAYPDGWPVCPDGCVIAERSGVLQPVIESRIDVIGFNKVCTREEFEAAHAKRKTKLENGVGHLPQCKGSKQWPAPGTLPPVGVECEYSFDGKSWRKVVYQPQGMLLWLNMENYGNDIQFRPIQSERDRLIEQALKVYDCGCKHSRDVHEALYDAGMLKDPKQ